MQTVVPCVFAPNRATHHTGDHPLSTSPNRLPQRFLEQIWGKQPDAPYRFLAQKDWDTGAWSDMPCGNPHPDLLDTTDTNDLYFAPCVFADSRRLRRNALPGRWLYADLDEVSPADLPDTPRPTLTWETSPGRWQAMWLLDRPVRPRLLEQLNQRLTYMTGADKGGWSLTKVLRVPGTVSTKRPEHFRVRLHPVRQPTVHSVEDMHALLRDVDTAPQAHSHIDRPNAPDLPDPDLVYRRRRRQMSVRARQLYRTATVLATDDRSARLWELENHLIDAGLPLDEILALVRHSQWNKYHGQRRELDMLWREITRAAANRAAPANVKPRLSRRNTPKRRNTPINAPKAPKSLLTVSYRDLMTRSLPRTSWMVEGIWSEAAHGLLGGESKAFKTLITLDLAVSVASGTPFLGRFNVPKVGPVLIIQEENNPGDIQDRLMRITASRGIGPALHTHTAPRTSTNGNTTTTTTTTTSHTIDFGHDLPIELANNIGFNLNDPKCLKDLDRYCNLVKPALVILDPLYLLTPGIDEDSAVQMTPILRNLLRLKQKHDCGIMIVHHYKKATKDNKHTSRSAERMSGTGVFHRWLASGLYVERPDETRPIVRLSSEHRSQASPGAFSITFDLGTDEDEHYEAIVGPWRDATPSGDDIIKEVVTGRVPTGQGSNTATRLLRLIEENPTMTATDVAEEMDLKLSTIRARAKEIGYFIRDNQFVERARGAE